MNKKDIKGDLGNFNPTVMLPLIYNENLNFDKFDSVMKVNANDDNSDEVSNEILKELNLNKNNYTPSKICFS